MTDKYQKIIENIGGKENINNLTHCATRLRFNLKNKKLASKEELEKINGVIAVVESGELYQVVIGSEVNEWYRKINNLVDDNKTIKDEVLKKEGTNGKVNLFSKMTELLSSIFSPIIYYLAASGILKAFLSLSLSLELLKETENTYIILSAIGDIVFYFLPVILAYTCSKRFNTNRILSVMIGLSLFYPSIITAADGGGQMSFLSLPFKMLSFSGTVFPIIFAVYTQSKIESLLKKLNAKIVKNFLDPLIILLTVIPITFFVFGPIGQLMSNVILNSYNYLYDLSPAMTGAFIGLLWQVITMFGLQWSVLPLDMAYLAAGFNPLNAMVAPTIVSQGGAALGVALKAKKQNNESLKTLGYSAALTSLFGVSEPALYGINLKLKKPFVISSIVAMVGGALIGGFGVGATSYSVPSILVIPMYMSVNFPIFLLSYFGSFIVSGILSYILVTKRDLTTNH